jgi:two-component system, NtrC family, nitrogen regulation sensor histidine kinase NtrY
MLLKNFFVNVLIRVALIVVTSIVLGIVLQHLDQGFYYCLAGLIFLILLQTWMMVSHVNKTNRDLSKFFSMVQDHDSSLRFYENAKNKSFSVLHNKMNNLTTTIQQSRIENERTNQFLQNVVDHVEIGLIAFDKDGNMNIYNSAAKKYLEIQQPVQLSSLKRLNNEMYNLINSIQPGQEVLQKLKRDNLLQNILVKATEMKFENNSIKLVSFQDITNELDKKELDSWQRLIRVLTHEIMNSISPITSLTSVISGYFINKEDARPVKPEDISYQTINKTLAGLETIEETGKSLLDFVDKYRSLTSLPGPEISKFTIDSLFLRCRLLMESTVQGKIKIRTSIYPEDLTLSADFNQVEQILINLIKNGIEALSCGENGTIILKAFYDNESTVIIVEDNGKGISQEIIDDIFVPFYTTKENGSGIGLSLSKQIMQNHNGTISVNSIPDEGSAFTLKFPK